MDLANTYGYYSSGESFSIADTEEVWVMDLIGKVPFNNNVSHMLNFKGKKFSIWETSVKQM